MFTFHISYGMLIHLIPFSVCARLINDSDLHFKEKNVTLKVFTVKYYKCIHDLPAFFFYHYETFFRKDMMVAVLTKFLVALLHAS